jgi:hypothetical protein
MSKFGTTGYIHVNANIDAIRSRQVYKSYCPPLDLLHRGEIRQA